VRTEEYKKRLLAEEHELLIRSERAGEIAREPGEESAGDIGDKSVDNEVKEDQFKETDSDWKVLSQVRDALTRIENGTFGQCLVDGGPIEEKRLEAIPWTPYCAKHQQLLESSSSLHTPTL
jgi:DnaK suppressor protein